MVEQQQLVGVLAGERQIVQRSHDRQRLVAAELSDEVQDVLLAADVERARRLVEQQDARLLGEGAGEHHALALATAERSESPGGHAERSSLSSAEPHGMLVVGPLRPR